MLFDPNQLSLNTKPLKFSQMSSRAAFPQKCMSLQMQQKHCLYDALQNNERTGNAGMLAAADIQVKTPLHLS